MEQEILDYIANNKEDMDKNDFDDFFESDNYNNIKDEDSKRTIFYMTAFLMSTKEYKEFGEIIKEFIKIIGAIKENKYLQKTHECYEELISNFLKNIRQLLNSDDIYENKYENIFIQNLNHLVEELDKIIYPPNLKLNSIINNWKRIYDELISHKDNIKKDNIKKFERYTKHLNNYIKNLEDQEKIKISQNNINNSDFKIIYNSSIYNNSGPNKYENYENNEEEDEKEEIGQLKQKQETVDNFITNEMIPNYFSNENNKNFYIEDKNRINNETIKIPGSNKSGNIKNKNNKDIQNKNLNNAFPNCYRPIPSHHPNIFFIPYYVNDINQPIPFLNNMQFNMNNNNNQYFNNKK